MRTKEFFMRLGFLLPVALWSIFIFLVIFGIVANLFGADSTFYCTVFCKTGITMFSAAFISIIYCQAKSCRHLK